MTDVTDTLTRYLALCDVPARTTGDLADLFTEHAVWEGGGSAYAEKFGRTEGREAIVAMLSAYLPPSPHFRTNVHLLFPGTVDTDGRTARGSWPMQQLSRYESGDTEVMVARLDVTFRLDPDRARISAFRTERLFSAPLMGQR
ncbi:nuclear transport factor 2 family protein [Streptomyces spongiae]|uniref:Nuclear transport factor 2 family protein n=1 Tax=Streptomyces spongiae TaxID=565072 RepID=A0A5N8XDB8_9ACTN|nr:nuclear transport factor 2 family protein [Streptomyces spongiae]MPY57106.1 nuclear transport factor 2 family protein [Streptomyces spongiae]